MDIEHQILYTAGAEEKRFSHDDHIFSEGNHAHYYYQIVAGQIKLSNHNKEGKEYIQNIITEGQCFGEAMLFNNKEYPMNAVAMGNCVILKLSKINFIAMLKLIPQLYETLCALLSERFYFQCIMLQANSLQNPTDRMTGLMDYLKRTEEDQSKFSYKIPFTRQQMANLTGICVETAIRTLKKMEKNDMVKITDRKIYF